MGKWRAAYVNGALASLYLNVFVLVVQLFTKVPALHATMPPGPAPCGPAFGAVQGLVLLACIWAGWQAVKRFRPLIAA